MDQKWIQILVILVFYQRFASGLEAVTVKQGESVKIECRPPEKGNILVWFRALDNSGMEFIASFSNGILKSVGSSNPKLKITNDVLTMTSFSKNDDSGLYSCGTIKSNELKFGPVTRVVGVKDPVTAPAPAPQDVTTQPCPSTTTKPCRCDGSKPTKQEDPSLYCPLVILGPLAGACGLLLLLLIVTTLYCNKIRTRRCPHHYRKRPQTVAPRKQMMTDRHV